MKKEVIVHQDPKSPISEVFRTLRTNLQFTNQNRSSTLLITSTLPGEGKSWVSANLAVSFAQAGKKVILIDSDMRKGRQSSIFEVVSRPGLSNILSNVNEKGKEEEVTLLSCIQSTEVENLSVIPTGNVPPNPSELLITDMMKKMLEELKELFDIVIFDAPPTLLVTDAVILSRFMDSTIIVTAHHETKVDNLVKVKQDIEKVGGKIAGVIVNKMPISAKKYANSYYYGSSDTKGKDQK